MIDFSEQPGGGIGQDPASKPELSSGNLFFVAARGERILLLGLHPAKCLQGLSREEAVNLAAWLAVIADPEGDAVARVIEAIKQM